MNKYILSLFILIFALPCFAGNVVTVGLDGSPGSSASGFVGNNCTVLTNLLAVGGVDQGASQLWTPTTNGPVSTVHAALGYTTTSDTYNVMIVDASGNKLAESNLTNYVAGWTDFTLDSPLTVSISTPIKFVIGSATDTGWRIAIENTFSNPNNTLYGWSVTVGDTMPATIDDSGGTSSTSDICIYAD